MKPLSKRKRNVQRKKNTNELLPEEISILVVEDDPGDFGLIQALIRQSGYVPDYHEIPVLWVTTLAEGIAEARRWNPDIILLDLSLPDSSGLATVQAMRGAVGSVPIVVLTGHDDQTLAIRALETGAQDYLVKGQFDHESLGRTLRYALVRSKLAQRQLHQQRQLEEMVEARTTALNLATEAATQAQNSTRDRRHDVREPLYATPGMTDLGVLRRHQRPRKG